MNFNEYREAVVGKDKKIAAAYREYSDFLNQWNEMGTLSELSKYGGMTPIEKIMFLGLIWLRCATGATVIPQATIGDYRADFLIEFSGRKIVVECDGHDFHEKTKAQAAHDRARDRYMQGLGYRVYRYTGSEIWKDVQKCVQEIANAPK